MVTYQNKKKKKNKKQTKKREVNIRNEDRFQVGTKKIAEN